MFDDAAPWGPSSPSEASGNPSTPAGAYEMAHLLYGPDEPTSVQAWPGGPLFPNVMGPATQSVYDYLECLKSGLVKWARREGWRVAEGASSIRDRPYLLVPDRAGGGHTVVRGYRLRDADDAGASQAPPYLDRPWVDRGAPRWTDVPINFVPGILDRRVIWVSRDPADSLLLGSLGLTAVSLAAPCETLGSEEMVRRLVGLQALDPEKPRRLTIVVVDPDGSLGEERGGLLCGLFENVWEVRPSGPPVEDGASGGVGGPHSLTGWGLAALVWTCTYPGSNPVEDMEAHLMERVSTPGVGRSCHATPVLLDRVPMPTKVKERGSAAERSIPFENDRSYPAVLRTHTAAEIIEAGKDAGEEIVEPFASPGRFTEVQGDTQIGKSTFLLELVAAVARGKDFLGKRTVKSHVVYVTERSKAQFSDETGKAAGPLEGVDFVTSDDYWGMDFPQVVELVGRLSQQSTGARLVVFDTIYSIAGLEGGQSRTDGRIRGLYRTLRPLVAGGAAVVLVRHGADAGGSFSKTGDGSRAFGAEASTSVRFRSSKSGQSHRKLDVKHRRLGEIELTVARTPAGRFDLVIPTGGDDKAVASETGGLSDLDRAVLQALAGVPPPGLMSKDIVLRLADESGQGPKRFIVDKSLRALVERGLVAKTGSGRGQLPFLYALVNP